MTSSMFDTNYDTFLGNDIVGWCTLAVSILFSIFFSAVFIIVSIFWIIPFVMWIYPSLLFMYYHMKAYRNNMSFEEYAQMRELKKHIKMMEKEDE